MRRKNMTFPLHHSNELFRGGNTPPFYQCKDKNVQPSGDFSHEITTLDTLTNN